MPLVFPTNLEFSRSCGAGLWAGCRQDCQPHNPWCAWRLSGRLANQPRENGCELLAVPSLLFILAHPDDETFFAAGTIAKYIDAGVRVYIVCATRGERGATADLCPVEELPQVREAELRDADRVLG